MGFDAAAIFEELDYDFTKFSNAPDAKGIVPEPTRDQINAFREVMAEVYPTKKNDKNEDVLDVDAIAARTKEADAALEESILIGLAALCSEQPSLDTLIALPWRIQNAFFGWVFGTFFGQTAASTPVTNTSQATPANELSSTSPDPVLD
ncbi:MAG: hypothetical protein ACM3UO_00185 [Bacillota bacterium]